MGWAAKRKELLSVAWNPVGGMSVPVYLKAQYWGQYSLTFSPMTWDTGSEYTLRKFSDATKLGGVTEKPCGCSAVQSDLNRLEK